MCRAAHDRVTRGNRRMICNLIPRINAAVLDYKKRFCAAGFNTYVWCARTATCSQNRGRRKQRTVMHGPGGCAGIPKCWEYASEEDEVRAAACGACTECVRSDIQNGKRRAYVLRS